MQYPKTIKLSRKCHLIIFDFIKKNWGFLNLLYQILYLLLILFASSNVFPSLWVFFVISDPARSSKKKIKTKIFKIFNCHARLENDSSECLGNN